MYGRVFQDYRPCAPVNPGPSGQSVLVPSTKIPVPGPFFPPSPRAKPLAQVMQQQFSWKGHLSAGDGSCAAPMANKRWSPSRRTPRRTLRRVRTYAACCAQCKAALGCRRFDVGWQGCTLYFTINIGTVRARGYQAGRGEARCWRAGALCAGCRAGLGKALGGARALLRVVHEGACLPSCHHG